MDILHLSACCPFESFPCPAAGTCAAVDIWLASAEYLVSGLCVDCRGMGPLSHRLIPPLTLGGATKLVFTGTAVFYCPQKPTAPGSCTTSPILIFSPLVGVMWRLAMVCSFQMTQDTAWMVVCLLANCTSPLEKCSYRSFAPVLTGSFVILLLSCKNSLYILSTGS